MCPDGCSVMVAWRVLASRKADVALSHAWRWLSHAGDVWSISQNSFLSAAPVGEQEHCQMVRRGKVDLWTSYWPVQKYWSKPACYSEQPGGSAWVNIMHAWDIRQHTEFTVLCSSDWRQYLRIYQVPIPGRLIPNCISYLRGTIECLIGFKLTFYYVLGLLQDMHVRQT